MSIITVEKDGIPVGFSSRLKAIREKANKFLHHKLGSDELTEEEEGDTRLSIKKLPVVVDTSMGASDKVPINGGFTGRGKEKETVKVKEEKEEERTDDKSSGDEKPIVKVIKKEENTEEQDDNAKEDDDGKSKSETIKVDKNEKG